MTEYSQLHDHRVEALLKRFGLECELVDREEVDGCQVVTREFYHVRGMIDTLHEYIVTHAINDPRQKKPWSNKGTLVKDKDENEVLEFTPLGFMNLVQTIEYFEEQQGAAAAYELELAAMHSDESAYIDPGPSYIDEDPEYEFDQSLHHNR